MKKIMIILNLNLGCGIPDRNLVYCIRNEAHTVLTAGGLEDDDGDDDAIGKYE